MPLFRAIIAAALLASAGCSTIMTPGDYDVSVTSEPAAAEYQIRNEAGEIVKTGTTPDVVKLSAAAGYFDGERYTVSYTRDGHETAEVVLDSEVTSWYWWGLIPFPITGGLLLDPMTGNMYRIPEKAHADLPPSPLALDQ